MTELRLLVTHGKNVHYYRFQDVQSFSVTLERRSGTKKGSPENKHLSGTVSTLISRSIYQFKPDPDGCFFFSTNRCNLSVYHMLPLEACNSFNHNGFFPAAAAKTKIMRRQIENEVNWSWFRVPIILDEVWNCRNNTMHSFVRGVENTNGELNLGIFCKMKKNEFVRNAAINFRSNFQAS